MNVKKSRKPERSWGPAVRALLDGKVIRFSDLQANQVSGRISAQSPVRGRYRVNIRTTPNGVVAWLTSKEPR